MVSQSDFVWFYALDRAVWYNSLGKYVLEWKDLPEEPDGRIKCPGFFNKDQTPRVCDDLEFLWMLLVCRYGRYDTSPRSGWIEQTDDFRIAIHAITRFYRDALGD